MANAAFIRTHEENGLSRSAAEAIAEAIDRRRSPRDDPRMLAYAALLTTLLVGGFGWTAAQFNAVDNQFNAVSGQFNALNSKIGTLDSKIDAHSERLARIETLLSERLPAPQ